MPSLAQLQGQRNTTEQNSHQKKELGGTFTPTQIISKENVGKTQSHKKDSTELKQHDTAPHKVSNSAWVWRSYLTLQHTVEKFFPTKLCFIFNHQLSLKNGKQKKTTKWSVTCVTALERMNGKTRIPRESSNKELESLPKNINTWGAEEKILIPSGYTPDGWYKASP